MDSDTGRSFTSSEASLTSSLPASFFSSTKTSPLRQRKKMNLTIPKPFNLGLPSRVEERMKYNEMQKHRQVEQERLCRERKELEEEEARKEHRKSSIGFKANRVRTFKPINIQPSGRPLTVPESPVLMTSLLGSRKKSEGEDTGEGEGRGGRGTQRGGRERKGRPGAGSSAGSSREDSSSPVEESVDGSHIMVTEIRNGTPNQVFPERAGVLVVMDYGITKQLTLFCDIAALIFYYLLVYYTVYLSTAVSIKAYVPATPKECLAVLEDGIK